MTENNTSANSLSSIAGKEQIFMEKLSGIIAEAVGWIEALQDQLGHSPKLLELARQNAYANIALSDRAKMLGISMERLDRINNLAVHIQKSFEEFDNFLIRIHAAKSDPAVKQLLKNIKDITGVELLKKDGRLDPEFIDKLREKTKRNQKKFSPVQDDFNALGSGGQILSSILVMTDKEYEQKSKDYNGHPPSEEDVEKDKNFIHLSIRADNEKNNVIGKVIDNARPGMEASLKTGTNIYRDHPDETAHALTTIIAILTVIQGIMLARSAVGIGKFVHKKLSKRKNGSRKHHKNDDDEPPSPDEGIHEKKSGKYTAKPSFRGTAGKSLLRRAMMMAGKTEIAAGAAEMGATLGEGATLAGTAGLIGEGALAGAAAVVMAPEVLIGGAAISAALWGFYKYQQHQKKKQEEEAKAAKEAQAKLARNTPNLHQPDTGNPLQGPGGAFSPSGLPGQASLQKWHGAMAVSRTPTTVHHYTNCNNDYTTKNTVKVENLNTSNGYDFVHQMGNALHDIRWVNTQNCVR